jgi:hypothetical protein
LSTTNPELDAFLGGNCLDHSTGVSCNQSSKAKHVENGSFQYLNETEGTRVRDDRFSCEDDFSFFKGLDLDLSPEILLDPFKIFR